jgi:sushi domain-containing protein 2
MIMCIVCVVYQYRKKQLKKDPNYALPFPHSRSGSRSSLKGTMKSDLSDGDDNSIKKVRNYDATYNTHEPLKDKPAVEFDPAKKMDLDEDDITSSEGSSFRDVIAKDFQYVNMASGSGTQRDPQLGRRSQRLASDYKPIEEEDGQYLPPPVDSPQPYGGTYSPTFSNLDRSSYASDPNQSPIQKSPVGAIRVFPNSQQPQQQQPAMNQSRFFGGPSTSPPLTQNVGLPRVPDSRSTEV